MSADQSRIVAILDKFYVLPSSMSECLLREIELRQKLPGHSLQYPKT